MPRARNATAGAVLITGLLILAVMTILGLGFMRGTILQERMTGNLKEQAGAFQAAEAALQGALTAIEQSASPPGLDAWGPGSLVEACRVTDSDVAPACTHLETVLSDWRSSATPTGGVPLANLGASDLSGFRRIVSPGSWWRSAMCRPWTSSPRPEIAGSTSTP
jgi:Tfp pilus assembly protein PilX